MLPSLQITISMQLPYPETNYASIGVLRNIGSFYGGTIEGYKSTFTSNKFEISLEGYKTVDFFASGRYEIYKNILDKSQLIAIKKETNPLPIRNIHRKNSLDTALKKLDFRNILNNNSCPSSESTKQLSNSHGKTPVSPKTSTSQENLDSPKKLSGSHGKSLDSPKKLSGSHGKSLDSPKKLSGSHGKSLDSPKKLSGSHGKSLDSPKKLSGSHGKPLDSPKKLSHSHGKTTDSPRKLSNSHGRSHALLTDSKGKNLIF